MMSDLDWDDDSLEWSHNLGAHFARDAGPIGVRLALPPRDLFSASGITRGPLSKRLQSALDQTWTLPNPVEPDGVTSAFGLPRPLSAGNP
jgi:hypothetical protein